MTGSGPLSHEIAVGCVPQPRRQTKQRIERCANVLSTIPAKDKFVEVSAEVRLTDTMVGAKFPPFEVREYAVNPRQHDVGGHVADDFCPVSVVFEVCQAWASNWRWKSFVGRVGSNHEPRATARPRGRVGKKPSGEPQHRTSSELLNRPVQLG